MEAVRYGSEEVLAQLPLSLRQLMEFERFNLHRAQAFQRREFDLAFDTKYFPQHCAAFRLPCFWVNKRHFYTFESPTRTGDELATMGSSTSPDSLLLPIHPAELVRHRELLQSIGAQDASTDGLVIWAVPTSSTRTLLVWPDGNPDKAAFAKLSLHSPILGDRHIYRRKVSAAVGQSTLVQDSAAVLPPRMRYLFEPYGFIPRVMLDSGVIIRAIPKEIKEGRMHVAPLFALMGGSDEHPPLLPVILGRCRESTEVVGDLLCRQFAQIWLDLTMRHGLILEAHAQDLMLALTPEWLPTGGFYYRDFDGLAIDWQLRRALNLPEPKYLPHAWAWHETYGTWGYRYHQLVSCKLRFSLLHYLALVLDELDPLLREWKNQGLISGPAPEKDGLTWAFSRALADAVKRIADGASLPELNAFHHVNQFVISLMKVRRTIIESRAS